MAEPIAPPSQEQQQVVEQPAGAKELQVLSSAIDAGGKDPERNLQASQIINQKIEMDKDGHINTQAQWGNVVANLLSRNYVGALNAYNGGLAKWEEGRAANGEKFYKEYNANGYTGRMADVDKNLLGPDQQKIVENQMGGVVTRSDNTALNGGLYAGMKASEISRITGLSAPVVASMQNAYQTSQVASRMNSALLERDKLTIKTPVLDIVSKMPADIRAGIFGFKTGQKTNATGETTGESKTKGASATETKGGTAGGGIEAGNKGKNPTIGGNLNVNASDTKQGTASENKSNESGTTQSSSTAGQEDIQSKIMRYVQANTKPGEEYNSVMKWIQLTQLVNQSNQELKTKERAPGIVDVADTELGVTSRESSLENSVNLQRNNAMESAWSAFIANQVRLGNQNKGSDALREEFQNSNTYKGITNKYDHLINNVKTRSDNPRREGAIYVNERNRPVVYINGKEEALNER